MNFGSNAYLVKYLKNFEDYHPLLILFDLNPEYIAYFNDLLAELDSIPNLVGKISQMKDPSNWQSIVSELEFARSIKLLNPVFVPERKGYPSIDVEINLSGEKIYFEVKLLSETDQASRVYREIWEVESDFSVEIVYEDMDTRMRAQDREKADRLIDFVRNKIRGLQTGQFEFNGSEIRIQKKISVKSPRTGVIMRSKEAFLIPLEPLRQKVFLDFFDKLPQFSTEKFVFWVIDVERRRYGHDDFKAVAFGNNVTDMGVGLKYYVGFEDIYKTYSKNPELFQDTDIVPTFRYPKKNGLFFLKHAERLNGMIVKAYGRTQFLLNPFADPQLDISIIRKLKNFFS